MKCKNAQQQMALAVGGDLGPDDFRNLEGHLADCTDCQGLWKQHQQTFALLQASRDGNKSPRRESLWPVVAKQIDKRTSMSRRSDFNGWIAGLSVIAACVLVFVFSKDGPPPTANSSVPVPSHVGANVIGIEDPKSAVGNKPKTLETLRVPTQEELNAAKRRLQSDY